MSSFCVNTISFKFVAFLRNSSATDTDTDTTSVSKMHLHRAIHLYGYLVACIWCITLKLFLLTNTYYPRFKRDVYIFEAIHKGTWSNNYEIPKQTIQWLMISMNWILSGSSDDVEELIELGINVNAKDPDGRLPIHWASFNGSPNFDV